MLYDQEMNEIQKLENQIGELTVKLEKLRKDNKSVEVKDYVLKDLNGNISLSALFGNKDKLLVIHNMGRGCRWCTAWADGINPFLPHLETVFSVVLASKDAPELQREIALARGWNFRMVSHGGGDYMKEQSVVVDQGNHPGVVCYEKVGNKILRKNSSVFGPGDQFCNLWHFLSLGGIGTEEFTPQFSYFKRPDKMDDGGQNL